MNVEGSNMAIHKQKKFLLDNMGGKNKHISFAEYCHMFNRGDSPETIDKDFNDYCLYLQ